MNRPIPLCILFALRRESAPFVRPLKLLSALPDAPCSARLFDARGKQVLVLETGIGAERAGRAITWVVDHFAPRLVVAAGFAGALAPSLAVGDIVIASQVVEPDDLAWRVALPAELGDRECGRLYTSPKLTTTATAKRQLFEESGAIAVDMESGAIAEACLVEGVPCACIRAISDAATEGLSAEVAALLTGGRVSLRRVLGAIVRRPRLIGELLRLERSTRRAAKQLADALSKLF